ncbi:hypothetical protein FQZ97_954880 [compost metagenome]
MERAKALTVSRLTGCPVGMPGWPAADPEAGIGVCSRPQGTSLRPGVARAPCVTSDFGTSSHLAAGKLPQGCTNWLPQMPDHARPVIRKKLRTRPIQKATLVCSDFHHMRPLADRSGTSTCVQPVPPRGHAM